ncbi:MAG: carboxylesterase [Sphingomonadales bacterium]|nr:MAG: carboxylesterase [Sphingomonadales bacterium]
MRARPVEGNTMRNVLKLTALAAIFAVAAHAQPPQAPAQPPAPPPPLSGAVRTLKAGQVQGFVKDGVAVFRGLPYAAPPVGELRWKEPQPVKAWAGVRAANAAGASCADAEDCLFLNVFTPANATAASKLPVFVWIHGGGFAGGSGAGTDGSKFARAGVIVVSINYRLARAGWFAHPALTAEAKGELLANYGNMDQIAALKWVRDNIGAFGGDATKVTLGGSSAGAISTAYLMMAPQAKGLFAKAISESSFNRLEVAPIRSDSGASAEKAGVAFAEAHGIKGTGADAAKALRALTLEQLRAPAATQGAADRPRPIADGAMITGTIEAGFRAGRQAAVPYLFGDTDDDSSLFRRGIDAKARVEALSASPGFLAAYDPDGTKDADRILAKIMTDESNREPNRAVARLHAAKAPTFTYYFTYVPKATRETAFGAGHSAETRYVFGGDVQRPMDAEDLAVSDTVNAYWAAFIKTGDPGSASEKAWPKFDAKDEQRLLVTKTGVVEISKKIDPARLDWVEANVGK